MSYDKSDAYESIAREVEVGHCNCYHIRSILIRMTEKQLSNPQITKSEKGRLERRLRTLKSA